MAVLLSRQLNYSDSRSICATMLLSRGKQPRLLIRLRIRDPRPLDLGKIRQLARLGLTGADDVQHAPPANQQGVADQRAMTTPWDRLGAHDRRRLLLRLAH